MTASRLSALRSFASDAANGRARHWARDWALAGRHFLRNHGAALLVILLHGLIWTVAFSVAYNDLPPGQAEAFARSQVASQRTSLQHWYMWAWFAIFPQTLTGYFLATQALVMLSLAGLWALAWQIFDPARARVALFLSLFLPIISLGGAAQLTPVLVLMPLWIWTAVGLLMCSGPRPAWGYILVLVAGFGLGLCANASPIFVITSLAWILVAQLYRIRAWPWLIMPPMVLLLAWALALPLQLSLTSQQTYRNLQTGQQYDVPLFFLASLLSVAFGAVLLGLRLRLRRSVWFAQNKRKRVFLATVFFIGGLCGVLIWVWPQAYAAVWGVGVRVEGLAFLVALPLPMLLTAFVTNAGRYDEARNATDDQALPSFPWRRASIALAASLGFAVSSNFAKAYLSEQDFRQVVPLENLYTYLKQRYPDAQIKQLIASEALYRSQAFGYEGALPLINQGDDKAFKASDPRTSLAMCYRNEPACQALSTHIATGSTLRVLDMRLQQTQGTQKKRDLSSAPSKADGEGQSQIIRLIWSNADAGAGIQATTRRLKLGPPPPAARDGKTTLGPVLSRP